MTRTKLLRAGTCGLLNQVIQLTLNHLYRENLYYLNITKESRCKSSHKGFHKIFWDQDQDVRM